MELSQIKTRINEQWDVYLTVGILIVIGILLIGKHLELIDILYLYY